MLNTDRLKRLPFGQARRVRCVWSGFTLRCPLMGFLGLFELKILNTSTQSRSRGQLKYAFTTRYRLIRQSRLIAKTLTQIIARPSWNPLSHAHIFVSQPAFVGLVDSLHFYLFQITSNLKNFYLFIYLFLICLFYILLFPNKMK